MWYYAAPLYYSPNYPPAGAVWACSFMSCLQHVDIQRVAKGRLLHCKRLPFSASKTAFYVAICRLLHFARFLPPAPLLFHGAMKEDGVKMCLYVIVVTLVVVNEC
jgi:hypothetical protein